jgi:hypothetical protein
MVEIRNDHPHPHGLHQSRLHSPVVIEEAVEAAVRTSLNWIIIPRQTLLGLCMTGERLGQSAFRIQYLLYINLVAVACCTMRGLCHVSTSVCQSDSNEPAVTVALLRMREGDYCARMDRQIG